jgi:uncharacterized protein (TIGR02118 family)
MVKLILYFRQPADVDAFEDHFANRHVPLIAAMPNVVRSSVTRALGAPRGEPIFYLIHEVYFADLPSMTYALNSAQGRAAGADVMMFARDVVTLMYGEVWGEDPFEMMGSEPAPASETEDQTQTPIANTNASDNKVPIDVSFLEKEKPREPIKAMTVEEAILGPDYKRQTAPEPQAVAVAETAAVTDAPVVSAEAPTPAATATDTPAPAAPHPPQPSSAETPA